MSAEGQDSRNPEAVLHDGEAWVVYESLEPQGRGIRVGIIVDEPEPIDPFVLVGTTTFTGDPDALAHTEAGHLWVTWVDGNAVGWSERVGASWSTPAWEAIGGDGIAAARLSVRSLVVDP